MARILIVEDEGLISMMLEDWLVELKHNLVGPAWTLPQALEMARESEFDAAILDLHLRSEPADSVADIFKARGIPFAISSGSSTQEIEQKFAGHPVLSKPFDFSAVQRVVATLVDCNTGGLNTIGEIMSQTACCCSTPYGHIGASTS